MIKCGTVMIATASILSSRTLFAQAQVTVAHFAPVADDYEESSLSAGD